MKVLRTRNGMWYETLELSSPVAKQMLFRTKPSYIHSLKHSYEKIWGKGAIFVILRIYFIENKGLAYETWHVVRDIRVELASGQTNAISYEAFVHTFVKTFVRKNMRKRGHFRYITNIRHWKWRSCIRGMACGTRHWSWARQWPNKCYFVRSLHTYIR